MNYKKRTILVALILLAILALALFFIVKNQGYIREAAYETTETVIEEGEEIIEKKLTIVAMEYVKMWRVWQLVVQSRRMRLTVRRIVVERLKEQQKWRIQLRLSALKTVVIWR
jgi:uncharacterized membrane protein YjgN (DUF898 family)